MHTTAIRRLDRWLARRSSNRICPTWKSAKQEGATLLSGGEAVSQKTRDFYMTPAIFTDCDNAMRISLEEIFGPVASVIRVKSYEAALAVANDTPFGLAAGICTTSLKHASHFKRNIEAGMAMVNLPTAGVDYHVPFGGRKVRRMGRANRAAMSPDFYHSEDS